MSSVTPYVNASAPPSINRAAGVDVVDHEMGRFLRLEQLRQRTTMHKVFIAINIVVIVTAIHLGFGQACGLIIQSTNYPMEVTMRLFTVGHAVLIVMNEWELTRFTKESLILRNFVTRGLYYVFVGCVGNVENDIGSNNMYSSWGDRFNRYNGVDRTIESVAEFHIMCISWIMILLGMLYVVMGMFCLNRVLENTRADYQARIEQYKKEGGTSGGKGAGCIDLGEFV